MLWEGYSAVMIWYDGLRCLWRIHFKMWKKKEIDFYFSFFYLFFFFKAAEFFLWFSNDFIVLIFFSTASQISDSSTSELRKKSLFFSFFLFSFFRVMPLIWATETVLDVYTLNKTSQEFSYINFVIRYSLLIMNYILYWSSRVSLP